MTTSGARPRPSLHRRTLVIGSLGVVLTATGLALLLGLTARMRSRLAAATDAYVEEQAIAERLSQGVMRQVLIVSSMRSPRNEEPRLEFRAAGDVAYEQLRLYLLRDLTSQQRLQLESIKQKHERLEVAASRAMDLFVSGTPEAGATFFAEMSALGFELLDAVEAFLGMREADLLQLRRSQDSAMRVTYGVAALFGAVLLIGSVALVGFLRRRVEAPLSELATAARRMELGELGTRVNEAQDEEFAVLAASFNRMAASLEGALDAARQSEESFRHLFADNPLPMWVYDIDTLRFVEVNDSAVVNYGYSREEFLRMRLTDIRPPEDADRLVEDVAAQRPLLSHSGEWRHRLKDGRIIDVDITSHLVTFGGRRAALVVAGDITEWKRAEREIRALNVELESRVSERTAALQASEAQFRTLAATAHDAIIAADSAGMITYFNPGAERMFGYPAVEMLGAPLTVLMPERFHAAHLKGLKRYVTTHEARVVGRTTELVGLRGDGEEFPVELSLASREVEGGPAFIGILRDITQRKETEEALERYATGLEAANAELEAFSYSVSHDLRAPLRSIHGFSRAVLEDYRDRLDEEGADYLDRVCAAAERMGVLIDDLLELSRATRAEMRQERVDLSRLAHRIATELRATDPDRRVELHIADGLICSGDEPLLALVLRNFMENAWKYTAKRDQAVIEVGETDGHERAYFVRDNGAGFDMRFADKLFQPFQRLHGTNEFPGTGIGLALVQRIVHRHGGRAWAEGAVDGGATFYFTIPGGVTVG